MVDISDVFGDVVKGLGYWGDVSGIKPALEAEKLRVESFQTLLAFKLAQLASASLTGVAPVAVAAAGQRLSNSAAERGIILNATDPEDKAVKTDFLFYEAAVVGAIVAAPLLYRAANALSRGKRAKGNDEIALGLDNASNRAVSLLASLGPAIAFPLAYISVQCLEQRGVITKGLGNAVQTGMAAAVAGQAASGIGSILSKVL